MTENIKEIHDLLSSARRIVDEDIEPMVHGSDNNELTEHLSQWVLLEQILDAAEALTKACNKLKPIVADRAQREMLANEIDELKFMGKVFRPGTKDYISIKSGMKEFVLKWLKNDNVGRELVKEDVHPASFQKFIREHVLEQGKALPDGVNSYSEQILVVRALPKRNS
jgi:hypothetical protein